MYRNLFLLLTLGSAPLSAQPVDPGSPDIYKQLKYRYIGPEGNRVIAGLGEPGNPNVYYAGAASGGVFKSEDEG